MAEPHRERIVARPGVMGGKPCLAGTRIPVYVVLQALAAELGFAGVRAACPDLSDDDIAAALRFAADWLEGEEVVAVAAAPA